jgi:hypothetical protein
MAYEQISGPFGGARGDYHAALISAYVVNSQRGKKRPIPLKQFLPEWDTERQKGMSPEEMFARARQLNARLRGTETRG